MNNQDLQNKTRTQLNEMYRVAGQQKDITLQKRILEFARTAFCYECNELPKLTPPDPDWGFCSALCHMSYGERQDQKISAKTNHYTIEEIKKRLKIRANEVQRVETPSLHTICAHPYEKRHIYTDGSEACDDCNILFPKVPVVMKGGEIR